MAERARERNDRPALPRMRTYGRTAAVGGRFSWLLTQESLFRFILSLLLAMALWAYINVKQDPTVAWDYPEPLQVSAQGVATNLTIANSLGSVHVRIRIDNRNTPVTASSFQPFVNVARLGPGLHPRVPIQVAADPGIRVVSVVPKYVPVALETERTRHVPVRWRIVGSPPSGYSVGHVIVDPSTVTISGPHTAVDQVTDATVYVSLSQARYSINGYYNPSLETSLGETVVGATRITINPTRVNVNVPVQAVNDYKSVAVLPTLRDQPAAGFGVAQVVARPSEITVYGSPSTLKGLDTLRTSSISLSGHTAGSVNRRLAVRLPNGVSSHIHSVKVTVRLTPVSASSSIQVGVTPQNLTPGLAVRTGPGSVLVTVLGPASALRHVAGRMSATINLAGYGIGTYQLAPQVSAPSGIKVEGVYPSTVTVTVTGG